MTPSTSFSRHDQHNLEFKIALTCPLERERVAVDLYLFVPHNLHLRTWSLAELRQDFHSRLRLAIQQAVSRQESSVRRLHVKVENLLRRFELEGASWLLEEIFQKCRELGAVLGELLKYESRRIRRELLAAASLSNLAPHPERILQDALENLERLDRLVSETDELTSGPCAESLPVVRLLRQYLHNLYTDFLVKLCQEQSAMAAPTEASTLQLWKTLQERLKRLRQSEAAKFARFEAAGGGEVGEEVAQELRLLRLSQIKKFFQSQMFIEVQRRETLRRLSEPAAAGAAAFAAMWAGAFEYFSQPHMREVGLKGVVVICIGAALYALKDRLKDKFRALFTRKLVSILPEAEQVLLADGKKVGRVREWFLLRRLSELPARVLSARRRGDLTEAECHLPEEILHYRQEFELEPAATSYGEFERSIQQVIRVNIERFLKRLDDPYKTIGLFDDQGDLRMVRSHRVYHFHAAVVVRKLEPRSWWSWGRWKAISKPAEAAVAESNLLSESLHRVVVDKNGVERVAAL